MVNQLPRKYIISWKKNLKGSNRLLAMIVGDKSHAEIVAQTHNLIKQECKHLLFYLHDNITYKQLHSALKKLAKKHRNAKLQVMWT